MIIDKEIEIKINAGNYKHFRELNYMFNRVGDIIKIKTVDLMKGSGVRINVQCEICDTVLSVINKNYNKQILNYNFYCCKSCATKSKSIITNKEKYGVDFPTQSDEVKEKIKTVNKEKYGSEYFLHSKKYKEVMIERYGHDMPLKSEILHEKARQTTFNNFGVFYPKQSEEVRKTESINSINKYGVYHYSLTQEYKDKYINTCLLKYGVSKSQEVIDKIKKTKVDNGQQIDPKQIDNFIRYYRIVRILTHKNKKNLYENWNGYDYYDGELIIYNFNIESTNRLYPTIDHKISVFKGFSENIIPSLIADINNLCITKRGINSSKNKKTENEFKSN